MIINSSLSFNILLHVTILFTILSLFFKYYITLVSSNAINKEVKHLIEENIKNIDPSLEQIKSKITQYKEMKNNLAQQYAALTDTDTKNEIQNKISEVTNKINNLKVLIPQFMDNDNQAYITNITQNLTDNFSYEYYEKLFSEEDLTRQKVNNKIFLYINVVNVLLIMTLLFFGLYLIKTKSLDKDEMKTIVLENILTFMCVGIVEYLFFTKIILNFIPAPPSTIVTSLITSFKKEL
jgi:F0F1-type ATP synthase membrane subunit b/b'